MNRYVVKPNTKVKLSKWDPEDRRGFRGVKDEGKSRLEELKVVLSDLQERLYAEQKHRILIVLQGMDTSGKDGAIRHLFDVVSPQGIRVVGFKKPSQEEFEHDYLWRVHQHTPRDGQIVIFNRSHYESLLAERVLKIVPPSVWKRRFDHINEFERLLTDERTTIFKFFLNISKDEQRERLLDRLNEPDKHWKLNLGDLETRKRWRDYVRAYEDVLSKTSTPHAPWHIVPANRKWYRNLVISTVLVEKLKSLKMRFPEPDFDLAKFKVT
jgi:PPK2 family polyphosphate:nucleotide phosphotransferase